jgi:DNA-binding response OmpR family regulator
MFPKEILMKRVWGKSYKRKSRVLDVYISRLRKKLGEKGKYLKTLPKFGYIFTRNV